MTPSFFGQENRICSPTEFSTETKSFTSVVNKKPDPVGPGFENYDGRVVTSIIAKPELNANGTVVCSERAVNYLHNGFVKIPRSLFSHPAWKQATIKHRAIFMELLVRAAWAPTCFYWNGKRVDLAIGQLYFSRRKLAKELSPDKDSDEKVSDGDIRGAIRYFEKCKFLTQPLTQRLTSGPSVVTITYSTFCDEEMFLTNPTSNPTSNPSLTQASPTKEEDKELKKKKNAGELPLVESAAALRLFSLFSENLKSRLPAAKIPKKPTAWQRVFDEMLTKDGRSVAEIEIAIGNIQGNFYADNVQSPTAFRREFARFSKPAVQGQSKTKSIWDVLAEFSLGDYRYEVEFGMFKLISPQGHAVVRMSTKDLEGITKELKKRRLSKNGST